ncbi:hypothetical protein FWG95_03470 [Candidatus Saccharibacteria bacterium]|nr:hypothetical protein [Candidatus Saccharibacteria bacterium]
MRKGCPPPITESNDLQVQFEKLNRQFSRQARRVRVAVVGLSVVAVVSLVFSFMMPSLAGPATGTCLPVSKGGTGACTLTDAQTALDIKTPLDSYPVGSIYISITNTSPSTTLGGGTWVQFGQGRTLLGIGSNDANTDTTFGNTTAGAINRTTVEELGGESAHTLIIAEMPNHNHPPYPVAGQSTTILHYVSGGVGANTINVGGSLNMQGYGGTGFSGGGGAHNNVQPYVTVYFWKRAN